jgi:hypothetical protein
MLLGGSELSNAFGGLDSHSSLKSSPLDTYFGSAAAMDPPPTPKKPVQPIATAQGAAVMPPKLLVQAPSPSVANASALPPVTTQMVIANANESLTNTQPTVAQYQLVQRTPSYFEQLWSSKRDTAKLILMSFVVVAALSIHFVGKFVIKQAIAARSLSFGQELALRSAYPLIILFFVWNFKMSISPGK